jgi:Uma2 family endonuclease
MSMAETKKPDVAVDWIEPGPEMGGEEFLALPDDGVHRELIRGHVREMGMTVRNRFHCQVESTIVQKLKNWLDTQPEPRGQILSGEVGFRLRGPEESVIGIDVAYASAELVQRTPRKQKIFDGPPILAVEILSDSDRVADVVEMVDLYREAGVVTWVVEPDFERVTVHVPGRPLQTLDTGQELIGDPYLPGFRVAVKDIFT